MTVPREHPWARHYQHVWQERAGNPALPLWFRVTALAYGSHRANGHATFGRGDVALVLGTVDPATGVLTPLIRQHVHRTIQTAIGYGLLAAGSRSLCLIVPAHAITGGLGREDEPCPQHGRARQRRTTPRSSRLRAVGA